MGVDKRNHLFAPGLCPGCSTTRAHTTRGRAVDHSLSVSLTHILSFSLSLALSRALSLSDYLEDVRLWTEPVVIPEPQTLNPQPSTLNPQPSTLNPEP